MSRSQVPVPSDKDENNLFISRSTKKSISNSHEPSMSTNTIPAESRRPMRSPPHVQKFPRPEIDLAGPSKTFPPQTTRDINRLTTLQKDAEKDKNKRSAEDSPGIETDLAICNAKKSAKGKKNPKVAVANAYSSRKRQNKNKYQS